MARLTTRAKNKWGSLNEKTQKIASFITAAIVIGSAFIGATNYIVARLDDHISEQTQTIQGEMKDVKLSTTRNELIVLIKTSPENVLEIEKVAKYYFQTLEGDWYMSNFYSSWAKQYGGDTSFVTK